MRKLLATAISALAWVFAVAMAPSAQAATTVTVTPGNLNGWQVQTGATCGAPSTGSQAFVSGPGAPPAGTGSLEYTIGSNGDSFETLRLTSLGGTKLVDLSRLDYSTYAENTTGWSGQAPYLILNLDLNHDGAFTFDAANNGTFDAGADDDQILFEPEYQNGYTTNVPTQADLTTGTWQTWDALGGGWWSNWGLADTAGAGANVKTISYYLSHLPAGSFGTGSATGSDVAIVDSGGHGGFRVAAGCGAGAWDDFVGNADAVTVGVSGTETTYDFEAGTDCVFTVVGSTMTLQADCTTDHTIFVPDGFTLEGAGHTMTAVDPSGDHFRGAVVQNLGASMTVQDLGIATDLADVCDAGADALAGTRFEGASGTAQDNTISVGQGPEGKSGCQEGDAIDVRNTAGLLPRPSILVTGNTTPAYIKTGVLVNGVVRATVTGNTITGWGPVGVPFAAQNGVQISRGATATIKGNSVSGNFYTPKSFVACGLLYFNAGGVKASMNKLFANEINICNFGRGGGARPAR